MRTMEDTDNNLLFTERIFLQKSSNFLRNILFPIRSTSPLTITYSLTYRSLKSTFSPQIILPPRLVVLKIIFVRLIHLQTNKYIFLLTPSSSSPPNFSSISSLLFRSFTPNPFLAALFHGTFDILFAVHLNAWVSLRDQGAQHVGFRNSDLFP